MKITKKICNALSIHNDWEYANGVEPYIYYHAREVGRITSPAAWVLVWPHHKLSEFWRDYGHLHFSVYERKERESKFVEAINWMKNKFEYTEIIKTPMGGWMDKNFVDKRNKEIEKFYKSMQEKNNELA